MDLITPENLKTSGLAVALLASMYLNYKMATNHMEHTTQSNIKLVDAIDSLMAFLKDKLK